jgi:hypothetical protein
MCCVPCYSKRYSLLSVDGYAAPTNFTPGNPITNPSIFVLGSLSRISSGRLRLRPRLEKLSVHFRICLLPVAVIIELAAASCEYSYPVQVTVKAVL